MLAKIEANLDFSEDGTPYVNRDDAQSELTRVLSELDPLLLSTSLQGRLYRRRCPCRDRRAPERRESRPWFNALLASERAIVYADRGNCTRDTLEEMLESGRLLHPVDRHTAGPARHRDDEVERNRDASARAPRQQNADVRMLVLDASAPLLADDLGAAVAACRRTAVVAFNKNDQHGRTHR